MKKFLDIFVSGLIAALIIVGVMSLIHVNTEGGIGSVLLKNQSTIVDEDSPVVTDFTSVVEIRAYQEALKSEAALDSIFLGLPEKTLTDVSGVLLKKNPSVTEKDIVEEYLKNRAVYDNLPPNDSKPAVSKPDPSGEDIVVEEPPRADGKKATIVSYNTKDTVIDGKTVEVTTKTTTYE